MPQHGTILERRELAYRPGDQAGQPQRNRAGCCVRAAQERDFWAHWAWRSLPWLVNGGGLVGEPPRGRAHGLPPPMALAAG
jgi:hypothetical protein